MLFYSQTQALVYEIGESENTLAICPNVTGNFSYSIPILPITTFPNTIHPLLCAPTLSQARECFIFAPTPTIGHWEWRRLGALNTNRFKSAVTHVNEVGYWITGGSDTASSEILKVKNSNGVFTVEKKPGG